MQLKKLNVGGQAVIEGVMIRGPEKYTVAARKKQGIVFKTGNIPSRKNNFLRMPFVRGFINLADMLIIGTKSLMWSAEEAAGNKDKITKRDVTFAFLLSIAAVIVFFIALPYLLTNLTGLTEEKKPVMFNLIDGMIRIAIFLIYIISISFMKDVRRLFEYHGAEHKAIHCYEKGKKLTVENVKGFTTLHPRCGTSFLLIVFIVSILVFSILPSLLSFYFPAFAGAGFWTRKSILFPARILLIPVVAGISYEILKMSDKRQKSFLFKAISIPGLLLQKITTKEPSYRQIEVAIASLKKLLEIEK